LGVRVLRRSNVPLRDSSSSSGGGAALLEVSTFCSGTAWHDMEARNRRVGQVTSVILNGGEEWMEWCRMITGLEVSRKEDTDR
jgi:protein involved in temperature-dependent protein secretion